ncbi:uncharacterized protein BJ212DRAFT_76071 [Suillus subaureus]|uniref:F-box domain-containing protein n=1 Tax=Suillus subaureus TaxID=48587 RepID=A0A9P7JEY0_9AGAM|nr:uncharacterized protein BJ212DRAFT_76071 [Suillus subaureus]KAG1819179.1 hypothetical protein BJ212DRAFT_76071 [Suillus subaureus]
MTVPHHKTDTLSLSNSHFLPIHLDNPEPHVHQLPVELLQQIFLLVVSDSDLSDWPSIFKMINACTSRIFCSPPIFLTRVCHLWRVVAHSTTELWSCIQVTLPGEAKRSKPFPPCLLQCWLARSVSQPLTIRINRIRLPYRLYKYAKRKVIRGYCPLSQADFRLLEILQSESRRWETVVGASCGGEWPRSKLDTPQLKTLECSWSVLGKFNAPNLRQLRISEGMAGVLIPIYKNLRHLHLQWASPSTIRSVSVTSPNLETIVVEGLIGDCCRATRQSVTYSCLESLTLLLPWNWHWFTEIFYDLHIPVLRKLTLVGCPTKSGVDGIMDALAVTATCNLQVIDFQPTTLEDEVDVDVVEPLLSVVREILVRGVLLRCRAPHN